MLESFGDVLLDKVRTALYEVEDREHNAGRLVRVFSRQDLKRELLLLELLDAVERGAEMDAALPERIRDALGLPACQRQDAASIAAGGEE